MTESRFLLHSARHTVTGASQPKQTAQTVVVGSHTSIGINPAGTLLKRQFLRVLCLAIWHRMEGAVVIIDRVVEVPSSIICFGSQLWSPVTVEVLVGHLPPQHGR